MRDHEEIYRISAGYEFPWDYQRALELALFRTYCVPSISALLDATGEFRDRPQRRYDDTALLMAEIAAHGYDSPRGKEALRVINRAARPVRDLQRRHALRAVDVRLRPDRLARPVRLAAADRRRAAGRVPLLPRGRHPDGDPRRPGGLRRASGRSRRTTRRDTFRYSDTNRRIGDVHASSCSRLVPASAAAPAPASPCAACWTRRCSPRSGSRPAPRWVSAAGGARRAAGPGRASCAVLPPRRVSRLAGGAGATARTPATRRATGRPTSARRHRRPTSTPGGSIAAAPATDAARGRRPARARPRRRGGWCRRPRAARAGVRGGGRVDAAGAAAGGPGAGRRPDRRRPPRRRRRARQRSGEAGRGRGR